jgi:putative polysaccharide biosynthesis protein
VESPLIRCTRDGKTSSREGPISHGALVNAKPALPRPKSARAAINRITRTTREILGLAFDERLSRSYWPEAPRKSRPRIFGELIWWLIRTGEANNFYYAYGLDLASAHRDDLMSYRRFQWLRNRCNLRVDGATYNYVCMLRDKFVFGQFVSSLGIPTPKNLALLDRKSVTWLDRDETAPLESLADPDAPSLNGFCKPLAGMQGDDAFPLRIDRGRLFEADKPLSLDELRARLSTRFLFQQRIDQHPLMSQLNASSVNTLRLISFCSDGRATVLHGIVRIGVAPSNVDNWAAGGLIVSIDLERGELRGEGFFRPGAGVRSAAHPVSGIRFDGFTLPHFAAAMAMVKRLHEYLPHIYSIGWDVAIATDGPVIIEGNDDWDAGCLMVLEQGFRQHFLELCNRRDSKRTR